MSVDEEDLLCAVEAYLPAVGSDRTANRHDWWCARMRSGCVRAAVAAEHPELYHAVLGNNAWSQWFRFLLDHGDRLCLVPVPGRGRAVEWHVQRSKPTLCGTVVDTIVRHANV